MNKNPIDELRQSASQASRLLKTMANEDRLLILCQLSQGEKNVGEIESTTSIVQPTLSQQLTKLREEGLVKTRKEGKFVIYSLASNEVIKIMQTLSTIYCAHSE